MNKNLKTYVTTAMLAALTMLATGVLPHIPVPATDGYVHLGDTVIVVSSMLFGPWVGAFAAALGSALADLIAGYTHYILPTFIIKGLMGYAIGKLCSDCEKKLSPKNIAGLIAGGVIMVGGYYIAECIMKSSMIIPLAAIGPNVLQYVVGLIIGLIIFYALRGKVKKL